MKVIVCAVLCCTAQMCIAQHVFWDLPESLEAGTITYNYRGSVSWSVGDSVASDTLTWRMSIEGIQERGTIRAWTVAGYPLDLAFYAPEKKPSMQTLIETGGKRYYLTGIHAIARIADASDNLQGLVRESECILELPLESGAVFGETSMVTRTDGMYCWRVEAVRDTSLSDGRTSQVYSVAYRALASVQLLEWMPGPGLIRYYYHHNGTRSDVDVRLISVEKP